MSTLGKTQIANLALIDIGAAMLSDIATDTSNEANILNQLWDPLRDEVLAKHNWDFAKKTVLLALDDDYDIDDEKWDYSYTIPADAKLVKIRYLSDKVYKYERRETHILCDIEDAILVYTAQITDTTKWDPMFVIAFAKRLSWALCRPLKRKGALSDQLKKEYGEAISLAEQADAVQSNMSQEDQYRHTEDTETFLTARSI